MRPGTLRPLRPLVPLRPLAVLLLLALPPASAVMVTPSLGWIPSQPDLQRSVEQEGDAVAGPQPWPEAAPLCMDSYSAVVEAGLRFCSDNATALVDFDPADDSAADGVAEEESGPTDAPANVTDAPTPEAGKDVVPLEAGPAPGPDAPNQATPPAPASQPEPDVGPSSEAAAPVPRPTSGWLLTAAAAAAAAAVAVPAAALLKLALLALRRRARDSPLQRAILAVIQADPGVHHAELRRRLGMANGTLEHHLRRLEAAGAVSCVRSPGHACWFPAGFAGAPEAARARSPLRNGSARRIAALLAGGAATPSALAGLAGLPPSTVRYHVTSLVRSGLVASARSGRERRLTLTEAGAGLVRSGAWPAEEVEEREKAAPPVPGAPVAAAAPA